MSEVLINGQTVTLPPTQRIVQAKQGRVRGFAEYTPHRKTRELIDAARAVLERYQDHLPITCRQLFYVLVTQGVLDKTEKECTRLCETMNRARRGKLISFSSIRDDGITREQPGGYASAEELESAIRNTLDYGSIAVERFQPVRQYVLCEAAGMAPQLARVAHEFGVTVLSSSGFDSVTAKHDLACEIIAAEKPTIVWHIGDHDPSGQHVYQSVAEDVLGFAEGRHHGISFQRLAVTQQQIAEYDLPESPAKETDSRTFNGDGTVQCEALPPDVLAQIVREALGQFYCEDAAKEAEEASDSARRQIREGLAR